MNEQDKKKTLDILNTLLERELAGVVRYTHYSFMIFGHNRIPIVNWMRGQATESLTHANQIGEHITSLGGHPSLKISTLLETHQHSIQDILTESMEHEKAQVSALYDLLKTTEGKHIRLEEFSRQMICEEELHISEVEKMLGSSS